MVHDNAQSQAVRITFAKLTDVGRHRGHNEDYVDAFSPPDPDQRRQKGRLFIVADGMGGHQAGEVASKSAVQTVSHEYYADPDPNVAASLVRAVKKANALIHQRAQEAISQAGMGTTLIAAVVRGDELLLANVGDSRAYLLRNGSLKQVTRDHSFVEEQIRAGILTREEARSHPQRNVITRALGAKPEVDVDTYGGTLTPGDTLLLCTDGLSEPVRDEDIARVLKRHAPQEAVSRLIALANEGGGSDNVTALVVRAVAPNETLATTQPVAAAMSPETGTPQRPSTPVIFGLGLGGLLLLALMAAGIFFFSPGLGLSEPTATPSATASPAPTSPPLPTPTLSAVGQATVTPAPGFRLLEPPDGAVFPPGASISFRWETMGRLPDPYLFVVRTTDPASDVICRSNQESCLVTLDAGQYEWWVEMRSGDTTLLESSRQQVVVESEATQVPSPTWTIPGLSPLQTPEPTEGD
jgi:serine/threonine protein phosphatase PrpC